MANGNGKDNDNVFDFNAMKKAMEELRKEQERYEKQRKEQEASQKKTDIDDIMKMMQAFGELFKPPSQEEIEKNMSQLAESLERAAKAIRVMHGGDETKSDDPEEGGEE